MPSSRQSLSHPNEARRQRSGVPPFALAIAIGEVEGERGRVSIDDDFWSAEKARGLFRKLKQDAAMALPLEIAPDAHQAKACSAWPNEIDAHHADDFPVVQQHVRKVARRDLVGIGFIVGLAGQKGSENRLPSNRMIGRPFLRRSHGPERIAFGTGGHLRVPRSFAIASLGHRA